MDAFVLALRRLQNHLSSQDQWVNQLSTRFSTGTSILNSKFLLETFGHRVESVENDTIDAAQIRLVVESQISMGKCVAVLAYSYGQPVANATTKGLSRK
ncbi:hypothetical protein N7495_008547 [Penicillium taxi]|uniref:uncharacterized protein n=1 Tax=Penicillium taxi TaxID=168475 RepID=UPI0025450239|nr:uncharacterized protein N7495_008547 [Penicillium taxi]KAJ5888506.1 hypothetical protein N7495_008547 [Penicillium taxi]